MRRHSFQSVDNRADGIWGAPAPPDFSRNKSKVFPSKRPSHKPTFQKRRRSFQALDNKADEIWCAGKALAPTDVGRKRSKASSLRITKTKDPPIALVDLSLGN